MICLTFVKINHPTTLPTYNTFSHSYILIFNHPLIRLHSYLVTNPFNNAPNQSHADHYHSTIMSLTCTPIKSYKGSITMSSNHRSTQSHTHLFNHPPIHLLTHSATQPSNHNPNQSNTDQYHSTVPYSFTTIKTREDLIINASNHTRIQSRIRLFNHPPIHLHTHSNTLDKSHNDQNYLTSHPLIYTFTKNHKGLIKNPSNHKLIQYIS